MTDKEISKIIKKETEIPDIVENRVMETLGQICKAGGYGDLKKKETTMRRKKMYGFIQYWKAAAIALVVLAGAGTSVYAAKCFGIMDFLGGFGINRTEEVGRLVSTGRNAPQFSNDYVDYTVREALCDSELIYMVIEARPKNNDEYLLVPQYYGADDSAAELNIEGVTEGTIQEYAAASGKKILYSGVRLFKDGELVSCTEDSKADTDGTVYYCVTGTNGFGEGTVNLTCVGTVYTAEMSVANRAEFEYTLADRSTGTKRNYTLSMPELAEAAGIVLDQVEIFETELGMYATFHCHAPEDISGDLERNLVFGLVDGSGEELEPMPYYFSSGVKETEGSIGGYTTTTAYQKPDSQEGISVKVWNLENGMEYGPYALEP